MVALGTKGVAVSVGMRVSVGSIVGVCEAAGIEGLTEVIAVTSVGAGAQLVEPRTRIMRSILRNLQGNDVEAFM